MGYNNTDKPKWYIYLHLGNRSQLKLHRRRRLDYNHTRKPCHGGYSTLDCRQANGCHGRYNNIDNQLVKRIYGFLCDSQWQQWF
jgi:hypothetical protein